MDLLGHPDGGPPVLSVHPQQLGAKMRNRKRWAIVAASAVLAVAIGGGAYAFTASNTVPATTAGAGSAVVSGYTVTNIHYGLNTTAPLNIDSLTFSISPSVPSTSGGKVTIQAALSTGGPTAYTCSTDTTGATATCATVTPQLTTAHLVGITVVAAQ